MSSYVSALHFRDLAELNPLDVCTRSGCSYNTVNQVYSLQAWNSDYIIDLRNQVVRSVDTENTFHDYFDLFIIHYLLGARGTEPTGEWISEKDMPGGVTFFRGPHAVPTDWITATIVNDLELFTTKCESLGGTPLHMADRAFSFAITGKLPFALLYWIGDDEFPAEAKLLFDRSITDHLALDGIYALMVSICHRFHI